MANVAAQNGRSGRGALADAAERLDRLARVVKDQQLSETRSGGRVAQLDSYIASPEEAWAKNFMTQAIGPATTNLNVTAIPGFVPIGQTPLITQGFVAGPHTDVAGGSTARSAPGLEKDLRTGGGHARQTVNRRRKQGRSWLGWMLLGR